MSVRACLGFIGSFLWNQHGNDLITMTAIDAEISIKGEDNDFLVQLREPNCASYFAEAS